MVRSNLKRWATLLLALLMLLSVLAACDNNEVDDGSQSDSESDSDTAAPVEGVVILETGKKTEYSIVYDDEAGAELINTVKYLKQELNDRYIGIELETVADDDKEDDGGLEILIGATDREESELASQTLTEGNEFVIKYFENGRIAIAATDQGMTKEGVKHFLSAYVKKGPYEDKLVVDPTLEYHESSTTRMGWKLNLPVYMGGELSAATYNIGSGIQINNTQGGKMQLIYNTTKEQFTDYVTVLSEMGYEQIVFNTVNENLFYQYKNGNYLVYLYYYPSLKEARVIEDNVSVPETAFEYTYTPSAGESTTIYQYGLMYDPTGNGNGTIALDPSAPNVTLGNNGMFYILHLADNSLILVDGGGRGQGTKTAAEKLFQFLCEITGVAADSDDKLTVSMIYITHAHGDHQQLVRVLLEEYSDRLDVKRAMYNIPAFSVLPGYSSSFDGFGDLLLEKYPDIMFLKPHTGQKLQIADVTVEVVYTHEDMVNADTAQTMLTEYNNSSTVLKWTVGGKTLMMLGDVGGGNNAPKEYGKWEDRLLSVYKSGRNKYDFLECDIVQIAHHSINYYMGKLYRAIKADYCLFPQADAAYEQFTHSCYKTVVDQVIEAGAAAENLYFAGRFTTGVTVTYGEEIVMSITQREMDMLDVQFSAPVIVKGESCLTYRELLALYKPFSESEKFKTN